VSGIVPGSVWAHWQINSLMLQAVRIPGIPVARSRQRNSGKSRVRRWVWRAAWSVAPLLIA
jgi:hypothetical protein